MILRFTVETKTGRRETFTSSRKFEKSYQVNDFVALCEKRNEKWGYRRYSRFVLYTDGNEVLLAWGRLRLLEQGAATQTRRPDMKNAAFIVH